MARKRLATYLAMRYPFRVRVEPDAGYVVDFPDLPGCWTGSETLAGLPAMIEESKTLWIETEYESGADIPEPTVMDLDAYSGKFNVRLPNSLHGALAEAAESAGVSLNQYVATLLARGDAQARVERRLDDLIDALRSEGITLSGQARVADASAKYRADPPASPKPKRRTAAGGARSKR